MKEIQGRIINYLFGFLKIMALPILAIILYYFFYLVAPTPFVPELISPQNNSPIEITPYTQLLWNGGTQDSLLSKIISLINREPLGYGSITYNIYISERGGPFVLESSISQSQAHEKEQVSCNLPNSIKDNTTYRWQVITFNNLGKKTEGPVWIFNTTFINLPPIINGLTSEPSSPQAPGAIITWTANASDPNNDLIYYKFFLNGEAQTNWIRYNKWTWKTSDYDSAHNLIEVWIRDGKHADANKSDDKRAENFTISTEHKILEIRSSNEFSITNIWDAHNKPLNKSDKFFYSERGEAAQFQIRGTTQYDENAKIWVVLTDAYKNYYLQYPPVFINPTGSWRATNIRPLKDMIVISFIKVDDSGDKLFREKVNKSEWYGFEDLPPNSKIVGSIEIL